MGEPSAEVIKSVIEVIGGFITDKFYNVIYSKALEDFKKSGGKSTTATYLNKVVEFEKQLIGNRDIYVNELESMRGFMRTKINNGKVESFGGFQSCILACFVPPSYLAHMNSNDCDQLFNTIILSAYKSAVVVVQKHDQLNAITGANRGKSPLQAQFLKGHIIKNLYESREKLYKSFARSEVDANNKITQLEQLVVALREQISRRDAVLSAMQQRIAENGDLVVQMENAKQAMADLKTTLTNSEATTNEKIQALMKQHSAEIQALMKQHSAEMQTLSRQHSAEIQAKNKEIAELKEKLDNAAVKIEPTVQFQAPPVATTNDGILSTGGNRSDDDGDPEDSSSEDDISEQDMKKKLLEKFKTIHS